MGLPIIFSSHYWLRKNMILLFAFLILTFSSFSMESLTDAVHKQQPHESSLLLTNNLDQIEIVIEQKAKNDSQVLPLKLLCAKKIMQSPEVYKKDLNRLPQEAHDLLAIYQPLTTENMYAIFKQAQEVGDKARKFECLEFVIENKTGEVPLLTSDNELEEYFFGKNVEHAIPKEVFEDPDFDTHKFKKIYRKKLCISISLTCGCLLIGIFPMIFLPVYFS